MNIVKLKNTKLKSTRGISFEDIVTAINKNMVLDKIKNRNQIKYPNQEVFVIKKDNYVYLVPFVEDDTKIFFKTIVPSRKMTKKHLKKGL